MLDWPDSRRQNVSLAIGDSIPVDAGEELVLLDLLCVTLGTEALLWVSVKQEQDDLTSVVGHRMWDLERALLNVLKKLRL